jgi:ribulose-phosphate 3-epimerase
MEVGLSVKPNTPIDAAIEELITENYVDRILVMTVEPGFGGQKFMEKMMEKVIYLHEKYPKLDIQVDGGIGIENAGLVSKAGANWLVAGSAIFNAKDRKKAIEEIKRVAL